MNPEPILFESGLMKVKWEDMYINIPFNFENANEIIFYRVVRGMQKQINALSGELKSIKNERGDYIRFKFNQMSNKDAELQLISYLKSIKKESPEITLFEISQNLKLPASQVENILQELAKKDKVKWVVE